ncbi:hypothetical protein MKQ68_02090 [Chitinophaga horti]|uniref:3-oxoacyl-ACP synthase n=1 Tax=Chitinophaga horti TaxID=2920382 RepID=A0ABY6J2M0_9BACT|nr:hypothetical protein [Chitinophaga horti]UYQ93885.1 hypothetical protein MKQ68_02090 [Chitinophaga horti]
MNSINAYTIIRPYKVIRNGEVLTNESAAPMQDFLRRLYDQFAGQYQKFHKMDHLSKLGWLATELLLQDMPMTGYAAEDTALVFANRSASLDTDEKYYQTVSDIASPALFVYTLPNIVTGEISIRHKFKGENAFFVADAFDIPMMTAYAQQLLDTNAARACICGWIEQYHEDFEAVVFLVEKETRGVALPFSAEQVEKLYQS